MGNYAITAMTAARHKPAAPRDTTPAEPAASPPAGSESPATAPSGSPAQTPAGESRLLTQLGEKTAPAPESPAPSTGGAADRTAASPLYRVQVGPFATRQEAVAAASRLLADGYPTYVTADRPYRVQVGAFARREAAARLAAELRAKRYTDVRLVEP